MPLPSTRRWRSARRRCQPRRGSCSCLPPTCCAWHCAARCGLLPPGVPGGALAVERGWDAGLGGMAWHAHAASSRLFAGLHACCLALPRQSCMHLFRGPQVVRHSTGAGGGADAAAGLPPGRAEARGARGGGGAWHGRLCYAGCCSGTQCHAKRWMRHLCHAPHHAMPCPCPTPWHAIYVLPNPNWWQAPGGQARGPHGGGGHRR